MLRFIAPGMKAAAGWLLRARNPNRGFRYALAKPGRVLGRVFIWTPSKIVSLPPSPHRGAPQGTLRDEPDLH
jgi:hypothetical protein